LALPPYAAIGALIIFLPIALYSSQWGGFLYLFGVAPIVTLVLLLIAIVFAIRRMPHRALAIVPALVVFWAVSWVLFRNELPMRSEIRWLFKSKTYKAQVLAQPPLANGDLRHIEWDGWGFAGDDTTVYLVFAPDDSLKEPGKNHASGKFSGIPCEVPAIHRLEKNWYTVLFYTDLDWDHCSCTHPQEIIAVEACCIIQCPHSGSRKIKNMQAGWTAAAGHLLPGGGKSELRRAVCRITSGTGASRRRDG
jgi:hypothetical protein